MRPVLALLLAATALGAGALGFTVARDLSSSTPQARVSVVEVPATPTPTPDPTPTPAPTSRVRISNGRGDPGCPAGCSCDRAGNGIIIRCTGG